MIVEFLAYTYYISKEVKKIVTSEEKNKRKEIYLKRHLPKVKFANIMDLCAILRRIGQVIEMIR